MNLGEMNPWKLNLLVEIELEKLKWKVILN